METAIAGTFYQEDFIGQRGMLYQYLMAHAVWDGSMTARKTASYGEAYNYSQMSYPRTEMPEVLQAVIISLKAVIGFTANNCLINYYPDGRSKMGFHADQTDILEAGTGIAIVSLGATRTLRFRKAGDPSVVHDIVLPDGSLLYMTQEVQQHWQHAIPAAATSGARLSLTFRRIR